MVNLTVIGGASVYTIELVDGIIQHRHGLPITRLTLMDIQSSRLHVVGNMVKRMLSHANYPLEVRLTHELPEALAGADFVITQIRVGGMSARLADETMPPRYGAIGQETVGAGGFASTLRTAPVMLNIARQMAAICPDAWLLNFTNPSGAITETVLTHTSVKTVGLCNIPTDMRIEIGSLLNVPAESLFLDYVGLNHLGWVRDVLLEGESLMPQVLEHYTTLAKQDREALFPAELLATLGMIPSYYLTFYYNHARMLAQQLSGVQARAERVMEIERELLDLYKLPSTVTKPSLLNERGGRHYAFTALNVIKALVNNMPSIQILNVANQGTYTTLPNSAVIETPCRVDGSGITPLPAAPLPLDVAGLISAVKASEQLTIEAALSGDERTAIRALLTHPLIGSVELARSLFAAFVSEHEDYLPQFQPLLNR